METPTSKQLGKPPSTSGPGAGDSSSQEPTMLDSLDLDQTATIGSVQGLQSMGFSQNGGTPKWMVYKGKSLSKMDDD